ncbi:hypothetical protein RhiJN_28609 [Ceratobasidium sp. AG-Ba]|nr:hypothetical protein RhiJN_28609 [Ceratobasidium sp. AG-Ba]
MPCLALSAFDSSQPLQSHSLSTCAPLAYNPTAGPWFARILRLVHKGHGCLRDLCDPDRRLGLDKTPHQSLAVNTVPDSDPTDAGRPSERPR